MCRGDGGGGGFLSAHVGVRLGFEVVRGVCAAEVDTRSDTCAICAIQSENSLKT